MGMVMLFHQAGCPMTPMACAEREPQGSELLVDVICCTVCRSDLHTWAGRRKTATPVVLGHEMVGRIAAFGPAAARVDARGEPCALGDRIVWTVTARCGHCYFCRADLPQKCEHLRKYGHHPWTAEDAYRGGLAQRVLLWPGTDWVRLPEPIPDSVAALTSCSVATAAAALRAAGELAGSSVVILGGGILGLMACAQAQQMGARSILVVDPRPGQRECALQFGATHIASPSKAEVLSAVLAATDGRGADVVFEMAGTAEAVAIGFELPRIGGTLVLAGTVAPTPAVALDAETFTRRMLTMRGVHNYQVRDLLTAVDFLSCSMDRYPFESLIQHHFPLLHAENALAFAEKHPGKRVAVVAGATELQ